MLFVMTVEYYYNTNSALKINRYVTQAWYYQINDGDTSFYSTVNL